MFCGHPPINFESSQNIMNTSFATAYVSHVAIHYTLNILPGA